MILITQPRAGRSFNEILALQISARELGWDVFPAPGGWRLDSELIASKPQGIPYGSQIFCEVIAQQLNWRLLLNSFDWLANLPGKFLLRQVDFMTLEQAKCLSERKFIKPADDKCFDAKVYNPGEFQPNEVLSRDTPVLVSDEVDFTLEYRCFVKNQEVKSISIYLNNGQMVGDNPSAQVDLATAKNFCQEVLNEVKSVDAVIDVGLIKDRGWAVIETNPVWASGLYCCDPAEALACMMGAVSY